MPKRKYGSKSINHVILRGINKQEIFLDNQDRIKFLKMLEETKEKYQYQLFAYVLMPNHVHMQIYNVNANLPKTMQAIEVGYTRYFNKKYYKTGPLFGDRYKNFPIETDGYFIRLIRYIHRNPEKARISLCENYKWSSYQEYLRVNQKKKALIDKEKCFTLLDEDIDIAKKKFIEMHSYDEKIDKYTELTEYELIRKVTDEKVIEMLKEIWDTDNIQIVQQYNSTVRKEMFKKTNKWKEVTANQLSRITGISSRIIEKNRTKSDNEVG